MCDGASENTNDVSVTRVRTPSESMDAEGAAAPLNGQQNITQITDDETSTDPSGRRTDTPIDSLGVDTLCKRCSLIPLNACPSRNLDCRSFNLEELAESQCKVCRLIGRVMKNYQPGRDFYRLDWHRCSSAELPVIGSLTLTPMHIRHNDVVHRIPVGSMIAPIPNALETVLQQLCPARVDFGRIRGALHECDLARMQHPPSHSMCARASQDPLLGLRLIDCHTRSIVIAPPQCTFVALSYVWGPPTRLTGIEEFTLQSDLPRTIDDSIIATTALGYSYLWIDRYVRILRFHLWQFL
jgi:hypothetical protein